MKFAELVFWAVAAWCGIGLAGAALSFRRGNRPEAAKHAGWVASIAGIYLIVLLGVSMLQTRKIIALGQDQCFGTLCFRVLSSKESAGLVSGAPDRVVRVRIAITNRGGAADRRPEIRAYLLDSRGRRWEALPGLSGNPLSTRVAAASEITCEPFFRVAADSTRLALVLTGGNGASGRFIVGSSDSLAHQPTVVYLER